MFGQIDTVEMVCNICERPSAVPVSVTPTGWPRSQITEVNINTVRAVIDQDRHVSVRQLDDMLHHSRKTIYQILKQELKMWRACSAWVPHVLSLEQMNICIERALEFSGMIADHPHYLDCIITPGKVWVHYSILYPNERASSGIGKTKHVRRKFSNRNPRARSW